MLIGQIMANEPDYKWENEEEEERERLVEQAKRMKCCARESLRSTRVYK